MARRAFTAIGALRELSAVRVRTVAVGTPLECDRFLKVSAGVTRRAMYVRMFAEEREFRRRVVKLSGQRRGRNRLPVRCVMARLAGSSKRPTMRIGVARIASVKRHAGPLGFALQRRRVALLALYVSVRSGQSELRFTVIELRHPAPIRRGVTLLAGGPQSPLVLVLMAGEAFLREAEVGAIQVLDLDRRFVCRGDVRSGMTLLATQRGMFSVQGPAGGAVIELRCRRLPADERKVDAVVFRMTLRAGLAGRTLRHQAEVQSPARGNPRCDLGVALQTFQRRLRADLVATGAVGGAIEE